MWRCDSKYANGTSNWFIWIEIIKYGICIFKMIQNCCPSQKEGYENQKIFIIKIKIITKFRMDDIQAI